jgi:acetolactate decarboxylase
MNHQKLFGAAAIYLTLSISAFATEPTLYAYSTIDALLAGVYDGEATVATLRSHGNFGLGTFNHLDGEMIALEGVYYHVRADGSVSVASDYERVPLAYVLPFEPSSKVVFTSGQASGSLSALETALGLTLTNPNLFYAVAVTGDFDGVSTRAIPAQNRPYKPLAEAAKQQSVFKRDHVQGTLVGIRSPAFSKGVSVPGWHWHFLSDDHVFGGHVLGASLRTGQAEVQAVRQFTVDLPTNDDFAAADQARDRAVELHRVESARP